MTNSRADPLFCLPHGIFYRDAFPPCGAPKVNGSTTNCCRWQISGICIDNCDRKESHVQLTGDNKKAFTTFFNKAIRATTPASSNWLGHNRVGVTNSLTKPLTAYCGLSTLVVPLKHTHIASLTASVVPNKTCVPEDMSILLCTSRSRFLDRERKQNIPSQTA